MTDHEIFDKRRYPIVDVQQGYGEWAKTYEQVVQDEMDIRLFNSLQTVTWANQQTILDLACGTGRIGLWLRTRTHAAIDGVDITPEMMQQAQEKGVYRQLSHASVTDTELNAASYDLCTQSLADEHLPDLQPLYEEVARITKAAGYFVIVGFHPFFLMAGIPTHYEPVPGQHKTIRSYVHLMSDHVQAAYAAGWSLLEMHEGCIDDAWLQKKPKWQDYYGIPVSYAMVWQQSASR